MYVCMYVYRILCDFHGPLIKCKAGNRNDAALFTSTILVTITDPIAVYIVIAGYFCAVLIFLNFLTNLLVMEISTQAILTNNYSHSLY